MISILHPSRSRPHQSYATIKKWIERAGVNELDIILSLDSDDQTLGQYYDAYQSINYPFLWEDNLNKNAIGAINRAAREAKGNIFIVVSDDTDCPNMWGKKILAATEGKTDFVLKTDDGIQKRLITMPIFDRVYYNRDGYVFNPGYDHLFADTEFSEVAYKRKCVIRKLGLKFPHSHYSRNGKQPDEVHKKNELTYPQGKKLFLERQKINFGL